MEIQILTSLKDSGRAKGMTIVIDVLRAFTTTCYLFANGAKEVLSVAHFDEAYAIKKTHPSYLLIGENKEGRPNCIGTRIKSKWIHHKGHICLTV